MQEAIYVVIPAFNEAAVIHRTVRDLLRYKHQIVIVDDGSNDNTKALLQEMPVHYLRHVVNLGQGAALQTGISYALQQGADYIVTFDADGQHCATDVESVVGFLKRSGVDVVFGSRFLNNSKTNISLLKRGILHGARLINFLATGMWLSDAHNGFRALNRKGAAAVQLLENGMSHATEFLWQIKQNDLLYAEYPVTILYTPYSKAKGQKLIHSFKVFQDILLHKMFR